MKKVILAMMPVIDWVIAPLVFPAAWLLKMIRKAGVHRLPVCRSLLVRIGVFPIRNHYYEPQFDFRSTKDRLSTDRRLPGVDWNRQGQLKMLETLVYADELASLPKEPTDKHEYYLNNRSFGAGDAEYWYQLIRAIKPKRIYEIGSGNSTLMAIKALDKNRSENKQYKCEHICIEPFEIPWLEQTAVQVRREFVENIEVEFFQELHENDILFIDSSHIIRPQGDVLREYLEILPILNKGVFVHVHDIFSPNDYRTDWLVDEVRFWNEQYLLEAFLTGNRNWRIVGALNFLRHKHYEKLQMVAPYLTEDREPGSFYIQKVA